MQNNTELLCLILEFQSRSLIVQSLLQAEATKEYKADWLKNADTVIRDGGGKFAKKGASVAQSVVDTTAILKQGFDLTGDMIQSLVKDPEFRKRAGIATGLPMAKLISNLATQANLNPKLTEKIDEWIATATKEFADQYGDDKSPMAQAIRNANLAQPPKDASFNKKMEFRIAQFAAYQEALESPEDFSKRDELIGKAATAAIPIGVSLAIALGFEVAIPLFLAQSVNWATILSSVALGEAADFAVQKGMDKLEINNPTLRIGASMVAGILAGGLVTGVNNKLLVKQNNKIITKPGEKSMLKEIDKLAREGYELQYAGKHEEAIDFFDKVLKIDFPFPDAFKIWRSKGESLEKLGKYEEAIKSYEETLKANHYWNNQHSDLLNRKGELLEKLGKEEEALESYRESIKSYVKTLPKDTDNVTFFNEKKYQLYQKNKKSLLEKMGRHKEAIEVTEDEIKKSEWDARKIAFNRAKAEISLKGLDEDIEREPLHYGVMRFRGRALTTLGRFDEALESYDKALKIIDPKKDPYSYAWAATEKAETLNKIKRHEEALESLRSALEVLPEADSYYESAKEMAQETLEMIKNAKKEIPKILDEAPQVVSKIPAFTRIDPMSLNKVGDLQSAIASLNKEWREKLGLFKGVSTETKGNESQKITILRGRLKDIQDKIDLHIQNQK
jgi:tetratricopeptide (TPR) repeat protein